MGRRRTGSRRRDDTPWAAVRAAFHRPETRLYRVVQGVVWALILASVALFLAELALADRLGAVRRHLVTADRVILWIFAVEIGLRIASYRPPAVDFFRLAPGARLWAHLRGRLRYCLRPLTLVDLLTVAALVPELRGLRAVRLLRTRRIFSHSRPFEGLARAFRDNGLLFAFAFSLLGTAVLLGGVSLYLVESGRNPAIRSMADGIWWALVTITTVGFGFSLVAHAIAIPGTGAIVSRVAAAGAHSIWVGRLPRGDEPDAGGWPATFGPLSRALKERYGILLLGLRAPAAGGGREDRINPPDDTPVPPETPLVYLAEQPRLPEP